MIRVLQPISGRVDGHNLEQAGTVDTLNPVIEAQLVAQGYAEYVDAPAPAETADVVQAPENAAVRTRRPAPHTRNR